MDQSAALATLVHQFLQIGAMLIFPFAIVRASRTGSLRVVLQVAGLAMIVIIGASAALASPQFGNRLVESSGYPGTFARVLAFQTLMFGTPILSALAVGIYSSERPIRAAVLYPVVYAAAFLGWFAGLITAVWLTMG